MLLEAQYPNTGNVISNTDLTCCSPWAPDTGTCIMVWPWPPDMACTMIGCPDDVMSCPPLTWTIRGWPCTYKDIQKAVIRELTLMFLRSISLTCILQDCKQVMQQHIPAGITVLGYTKMKPTGSTVHMKCMCTAYSQIFKVVNLAYTSKLKYCYIHISIWFS